MSVLFDAGATLWAGVATWYAVRSYGHRLEDREVVESAPVFGGFFAFALYLGVSAALYFAGVGVAQANFVVLAPADAVAAVPESRLAEFIWQRAAVLGLLTMTMLVVLEWALWQAGRIEHEWRIIGGVDRWT